MMDIFGSRIFLFDFAIVTYGTYASFANFFPPNISKFCKCHNIWHVLSRVQLSFEKITFVASFLLIQLFFFFSIQLCLKIIVPIFTLLLVDSELVNFQSRRLDLSIKTYVITYCKKTFNNSQIEVNDLEFEFAKSNASKVTILLYKSI